METANFKNFFSRKKVNNTDFNLVGLLSIKPMFPGVNCKVYIIMIIICNMLLIAIIIELFFF